MGRQGAKGRPVKDNFVAKKRKCWAKGISLGEIVRKEKRKERVGKWGLKGRENTEIYGAHDGLYATSCQVALP